MNLYSKDTTKTESNDNGSVYNDWGNGQPPSLQEGELIGSILLKGSLVIESLKVCDCPLAIHSFSRHLF